MNKHSKKFTVITASMMLGLSIIPPNAYGDILDKSNPLEANQDEKANDKNSERSLSNYDVPLSPIDPTENISDNEIEDDEWWDDNTNVKSDDTVIPEPIVEAIGSGAPIPEASKENFKNNEGTAKSEGSIGLEGSVKSENAAQSQETKKTEGSVKSEDAAKQKDAAKDKEEKAVSKTYTVSYKFESTDPNITLPKEVTDLVTGDPKGRRPVDITDKRVDAKVEVQSPSKYKKVVTPGITWKFDKYKSDVTKETSGWFFQTTHYYYKVKEGKNEVIGLWNPIKTYSANFEFKSEDGSELPKEVIDSLPKTEIGFEKGNSFTAPNISDITVEENGKNYTYHLTWNEASHSFTDSNYTFIGTWSKEVSYKIDYRFESVTPDKNLSKSVLDALPDPAIALKNGQNVTLPDFDGREIGSSDADNKGFWRFEGWDDGNQRTIEGKNLKVVGKWKFVPATFDGNVKIMDQYGGEANTFTEEENKAYTSADEEIGNPMPIYGGWRHLYKNFIGWSNMKPLNDAGDLPKGAKIFLATDTIGEVFPNGFNKDSKLYPIYLGGSGKLEGGNFALGMKMLELKESLFGKVNSDNKITIDDKNYILPDTDTYLDTNNADKNSKTIVDYYKNGTQNEVILSSKFKMNKAIALLVYSEPMGAWANLYMLAGNYNYNGKELTGEFPVDTSTATDQTRYTYVNLDMNLDDSLNVPDTIFMGFKGYSWRPIYALNENNEPLEIIDPKTGNSLGNNNKSFKSLVSNTDPNVKFGIKTKGAKKITLRVILRIGNEEISQNNITATKDMSKADIVSSDMLLYVLSKDQMKTLMPSKSDEELQSHMVTVSEEEAKKLAFNRNKALYEQGNKTDENEKDSEGKENEDKKLKETLEITGNIKGNIHPQPVELPYIGNVLPDRKIDEVKANKVYIGYKFDLLKFNKNSASLGDTENQSLGYRNVVHNSNLKNDDLGTEYNGDMISNPEDVVIDGATYKFAGWNIKADGTGKEFTPDTNVTQDETIYAIWEKVKEKKDVTYEFINGTKDGDEKGKALPKEVMNLLPKATSVLEGTKYTPVKLNKDEIKTDKGTWKFTSWNLDEVTITKAVKFVGTWIFTPKESPKPEPKPEPKPDNKEKDKGSKEKNKDKNIKKEDKNKDIPETGDENRGLEAVLMASLGALGLAIYRKKKKD